MKLIVGLGNYPEKYKQTRHNFGFLAVDKLVRKFDCTPFKMEKKFFAEVSTGTISGEKVVIIKPQTLMNLSGKAVAATAMFYKLRPKDIWVFVDDADIDFEKTRFREKGSPGGHNGLKSIVASIGSQVFPRIKMGISNEMRAVMPLDAFALQKFSEEELKKVPEILKDAIDKFLENLK
ncbi:MAG: aminoacyl-tRNA hydrolase [Candidatus Peregrinibacteria bacterium]|nr:aminoacyl-tRNA hydrolase [Candidatus Peregrinibacteria bacterium]